jgi:hypothetical protein
MNFNEIQNYFNNANGLEIGGPSHLLRNFYDKLKSCYFLNCKDGMEAHARAWDNNNLETMFYGDATIEEDLQKFKNKIIDLLFTSHTVEHIANPIKAIKLWADILVKNGTIINIVPNKDQCWDRSRPYTSLEHILHDYHYNTSESDLTHIHESACMQETRPTYYNDVGIANCKRIIHHHVYCKDIFQQMHEYCGFNTIFCDIILDDPLQIVYIGSKQ